MDQPQFSPRDLAILSLATLWPSSARMLRCRGFSIEDAKDLFQEALLAACAADPFPQNPKPWMKKVLKNLAVNLIRRRVRTDQSISFGRVESLIGTGEPRQAIPDLLATLPPGQKCILERIYFLGETSPEVGRALGMTPANVRKTACRARAALRKNFVGRVSQTHPAKRH